MSKQYYAVFQSSLSKVANGQFPERTGEAVTFYANAKEGMAGLREMNRDALDCPRLGADGDRAVAPCIAGIYRVELEQADIDKMQDVSPAFSAGRLSGSIPKGSIIDTQWMISADTLHEMHKDPLGETVNGRQPGHAALLAAAAPRENALNEFTDAVNRTYESDRNKIELRDPQTARALHETYSADGFMHKDAAGLPAEQAYCQQMMRFMTFDKPVNIALQTDGFHQAFNAKLDNLEAQFPGMPTSTLAQQAMEGTIKDFRMAAEQSHGLREQLMFDEMRQTNEACIQLMTKTSADLVKSVTMIVNEALEQSVGQANFNDILNRVTEDLQYEQDMNEFSADDSFGEVGADD